MPIQLKRNDTKDVIGYSLTHADGTPVNLTGATVRFIMGKGKTLITNAVATIVNAAAGSVEYTLMENDTLAAGVFNAEFEVTFGDGKVKTYPNNGYISVSIQANIDTDLSTYVADQIAYRVSDLQILKNEIQAQLDQFAKGDSSAEVAQSRVEADGTVNTTLKARLDKKEAKFSGDIQTLSSQMAQIVEYQEIEPEDLRQNALETDATLVQRAIDACSGENRKYKCIKLGRQYDITTTLILSDSVAPFMIFKGVGGGLHNAQNNPMFKGTTGQAGGGLLFKNVKFQGTTEFSTAPYFDLGDGGELIQLIFESCQFMSTPTILKSTIFIQSCRFINCNFKGMKDYQIKTKRVYDMVLHDNLVEWGNGGLINLTQTGTTLDSYCSYGLRITSNILEGIFVQSPIKLTANASCLIQGNYFEGNEKYDIDLSGGDLEHQQITVRDNFFGSMALDGQGQVIARSGAVKVGKIFTDYLRGSYDFSGNNGMGAVIFDFDNALAARNINLSKSMHLGSENNISNLTHKGFYGQSARKTMTHDTGAYIFRYPLYNETLSTITRKVFYLELYYRNTNYPDSVAKVIGYLHVIPTTKTGRTGSQLKFVFNPITIYDGSTQEAENYTITNVAQYPYIAWNSNSLLFRDSVIEGTIINDQIKVSVGAPYTSIAGYITEMPNIVGY